MLEVGLLALVGYGIGDYSVSLALYIRERTSLASLFCSMVHETIFRDALDGVGPFWVFWAKGRRALRHFGSLCSWVRESER